MIETDRNACLVIKDRKKAEQLLSDQFNDESKIPDQNDVSRIISICENLNPEFTYNALGQQLYGMITMEDINLYLTVRDVIVEQSLEPTKMIASKDISTNSGLNLSGSKNFGDPSKFTQT